MTVIDRWLHTEGRGALPPDSYAASRLQGRSGSDPRTVIYCDCCFCKCRFAACSTSEPVALAVADEGSITETKQNTTDGEKDDVSLSRSLQSDVFRVGVSFDGGAAVVQS